MSTQSKHFGALDTDHRPLSAPLVTSKAKDSSSNRTKQECKSDGLGDVCLGDMIILGELDGLDGQRVKVESISSPSSETNKEEDPVHGTELSHQAERVPELWWSLPFCGRLTTFIVDDNTLLPDEEIGPRLLGCGYDTLSDGIGGLVDRRHDGADNSTLTGSSKDGEIISPMVK